MLRFRSTGLTLLCALALTAVAHPLPSHARPRWCALVVQEDGAALAILDPDSHRRLDVPIGPRPHEVEADWRRARAYVSQFGVRDYDLRLGDPGDHLSVIDLRRGREVARWMLPVGPDGVRPAGPHGVKLRPPGDEVFVNTEIGREEMIVYDARSGRVRRTFPAPAGTHNFVFSSDGARLYAFAGPAGVFRLDPQTGRVLAEQHALAPTRGLAWSPDERALWVGGKGEAAALSPDDLTVRRRVSIPGATQIFYLNQAGNRLWAPSGLTDSLYVLDAESGAVVANLKTGKTPIAARPGPDGRIFVSNVQDDHASIVDPGTLSVTRLERLPGPNGLAFGPCPRGW